MTLVAVPFLPDQFEAWSQRSQRDYARAKVASGAWTEAEAPERARAEQAKLLPAGLDTPGHHLRRVEDATAGAFIGWFWIAPATGGPPDLGWLFDIEIVPEHRGQGHGRAVMALAEQEAQSMGFARLGLHVFAQNKVALHLYEACGFETSDVTMVKTLE